MENTYISKVLALLIMLSASLPALPYNVKGQVMMGNKAVIGANVKITDINGIEKGFSSSSQKGFFNITNLSDDKLLLKLSGEGFQPLTIELIPENTDIDLGKLNVEKITDLEEITVSSKSRVDIPGKTMVYVGKTERERAANPFNMLTLLSYKAPQIRVRESERILSIDGEEPEILVNGIKRSMSFISSLNPSLIEKIEFTKMPDIRFGKRSLNIITKRPQEGGWVMADGTAGLTTARYFYTAAAEYTNGKNDFMLYYNGGYRFGHKEYESQGERYIGGGKDITLGIQGRPSSTLDRTNSLSLHFTRIPSAKSMFAASAGFSQHDNDRKINGLATELTQSFDRRNHRGYKFWNPYATLYYQIKTSANTTLELNGVGSYTDHDSFRHLSYSTGYDSRVNTISPTWYFSGEGIVKQKLPFAWLKAGISAAYSSADNKYKIDGISSRQPLSSTRLKAYSSLSGEVLTVAYSLSAGITFYDVNDSMGVPDFMASLQRNFGNNFSLSYNFSYNPGLPPVSNYNDTPTPVNELMLHIAGRNLKSQRNMTNQIQFTYNKDKFYCSLQSSIVKRFRPLVTNYAFQDLPAEEYYGYFLEMPANGKNWTSFGADCNLGVSNLWNFLSFSTNTGWGHRRLNTVDIYRFSSWYLDCNLGLYWNGWQLNFTGENLVPSWNMWGGDSKVRRWPYTSVSIYKSVGKWNFHASWNNLFNRYGGRYYTESLTSTVTRSSDYRMNDQGNLIEIGVRYQLYTGKLLQKKNRSLNVTGRGENGVLWDY